MDSAQISKFPTSAGPNSPAGDPTAVAGDEINLGELLRQFWRRRSVILSTTIIGTLLTVIIVFQLTPLYTATSKVMITMRQPQIINIKEVVADLGVDSEMVESEIQVLTSRGLAEKVVHKLNLTLHPEFNSALRPSRWPSFNPLAILPDSWREAIFGPPPPPLPEEKQRARQLTQVVNAVLGKVEVHPEGESRVISISVETENPETAALVANTFADLYLVEQLEAKLDATRRATQWLSERVQELRTKVETSERAVEQFRQQAGLIQGEDSTTVTAQQISELNTQLVLARTGRAEAEARLARLEVLIASEQGIASAGEVLSSPLIQQLRQQEVELQRRLAEFTSEFGPRHPRMVNLQAEIQDLREKVKAEVDKIAGKLRNEAAVARVREQTLENNLARLESNAAKLNASEVQLRALQREATANRSLFETLLARMKETTAQEDIQQADARLISRASVPLGPSYPNEKLFIVVGVMASLLFGGALVLLIESLDKGFRSSEQLEDQLGITVLGLVPHLSSLQRRGHPPEDYVIERPASAFAEALRTLHTGLTLSDIDRPPRTVLLTSAVPNEGKTSISVSLARLMAKTGQRVLLIDADLRHPRVHEALGLSNRTGLVEVLANNLAVEDVMQMDPYSSLSVLTAGSNAPNAPELLGSRRMRQELEALTRDFDLIIVDTPPVLSVSDARMLCRIVDRTVMVIRWADTRREVASRGLKQIREAGGELAGVVLSMVNVRKHARYGYSDSGYYVGASRRYYTN